MILLVSVKVILVDSDHVVHYLRWIHLTHAWSEGVASTDHWLVYFAWRGRFHLNNGGNCASPWLKNVCWVHRVCKWTKLRELVLLLLLCLSQNALRLAGCDVVISVEVHNFDWDTDRHASSYSWLVVGTKASAASAWDRLIVRANALFSKAVVFIRRSFPEVDDSSVPEDS